MAKGYNRFQVKTDWLHYYFVWHTWNNKNVLVDLIKQDCESLLNRALVDIKCELRSISIEPNKVYIAIKSKPYLSPNRIIAKLKGITSKGLRDSYTSLKRMPSLWTRSYFVSTYGRVPNRAIRSYDKYVLNKVTKLSKE